MKNYIFKDKVKRDFWIKGVHSIVVIFILLIVLLNSSEHSKNNHADFKKMEAVVCFKGFDFENPHTVTEYSVGKNHITDMTTGITFERSMCKKY